MRMISAPISANIIAQNGPGPSALNSIKRVPCSGPISVAYRDRVNDASAIFRDALSVYNPSL